MSDTPRTDTVAFGTDNESLNRLFWIRELPRYVAPADFARQLERELAAVTAENERLRSEAAECISRINEIPDLVLANEQKNPAWGKAEIWGIERDIIPSVRLLCWNAAAALARTKGDK